MCFAACVSAPSWTAPDALFPPKFAEERTSAPPRSLVRGGQTSVRLVDQSSPPHANSCVIGPAVINGNQNPC
jgi:hypothetical protein